MFMRKDVLWVGKSLFKLEVVYGNVELNNLTVMMGVEVYFIHFLLDGALTLIHHNNPHKTVTFSCVRDASPDCIQELKATQLSKDLGSDDSEYLSIGHH